MWLFFYVLLLKQILNSNHSVQQQYNFTIAKQCNCSSKHVANYLAKIKLTAVHK